MIKFKLFLYIYHSYDLAEESLQNIISQAKTKNIIAKIIRPAFLVMKNKIPIAPIICNTANALPPAITTKALWMKAAILPAFIPVFLNPKNFKKPIKKISEKTRPKNIKISSDVISTK